MRGLTLLCDGNPWVLKIGIKENLKSVVESSCLGSHRNQTQTLAQNEQLDSCWGFFFKVSTAPSSVLCFTQLSTSKPSQNEEPWDPCGRPFPKYSKPTPRPGHSRNLIRALTPGGFQSRFQTSEVWKRPPWPFHRLLTCSSVGHSPRSLCFTILQS